MTHDPITGAPVLLDPTQPLEQGHTTMALLRAWLRQRPQPEQVAVDFYITQGERTFAWMTVRN